ncbi:MAG: cobalamin-dependent protein [Vallitaleaceae bacterium]|nr:cobalamin-dependent protein [Vallitaleaceae bacterium]
MTDYTQLGNQLKKKKEIISSDALAIQFSQMPNLNPIRSPEFDEISLRDTRYTLLYLADSILVQSHKLFKNYIRWFIQILNGLNLPLEYLIYSLHAIESAAKTQIDEKDYAMLHDFILAGLAEITEDLQETESMDTDYLSIYKDQYVQFLLEGKRQLASNLIHELLEKKIDIEQIYIQIFQESQYTIGKLWQDHVISVAQEHYCTATTQLIMGQLYPLIFNTPKNDYTFVGSSIGGELHELGIRMVSDFFELHGWNTYYLGANTPAKGILETVLDKKADVVGLSTTMGYHLSDLVEVIQLIRNDPRCRQVKILVGGYPFLIDPMLWKKVHADGTASNAIKAIELAHQLVITSKE